MPSDRWESLFEDLELQFAAERDAAGAVLEAERDRVRVGRLTLRQRLAAVPAGADIVVDDTTGEVHRLRVDAVGANWVAGTVTESTGILVLRLDAIDAVQMPDRAADAPQDADPLLERMDVGFLLRGLARRRAAVTIGFVRGGRLTGTPALVGADHVDLAVHDPGDAPRPAAVRGVRTLAFAAIAWVRVGARRDLGLG